MPRPPPPLLLRGPSPEGGGVALEEGGLLRPVKPPPQLRRLLRVPVFLPQRDGDLRLVRRKRLLLAERQQRGPVRDLDGRVRGPSRLRKVVVWVVQIPLLSARECPIHDQALVGLRAEEGQQLRQHHLRTGIPREHLKPVEEGALCVDAQVHGLGPAAARRVLVHSRDVLIGFRVLVGALDRDCPGVVDPVLHAAHRHLARARRQHVEVLAVALLALHVRANVEEHGPVLCVDGHLSPERHVDQNVRQPR
mmetsp:Transcript_67192/g.160306  ORF Transcript_67192/g.160306 Transcript_67192/m.160306 type:complete len:250 (+) Transcript_67192:239-988(+)